MRKQMKARRWIAAAMPVVLALTAIVAVPDPASAAGGPSVDLPKTASTPVTEQKMEPRVPDAATKNALHGDQPAGSAAADGGGTYTATPLSPSATWQVSPHTGDFTWTYPLRVPPAPGGLEPKLNLSYASSAVDGRTSSTNGQASWVGDGWDLPTGFIERVYGGCTDDTAGDVKPANVGDLCWRSDNATASYPGGGGKLIKDDKKGEWRAEHDEGARIERVTGAGNGDDDGESWKITTVDGTQYFFGSQSSAKSTWTVPVYGDDSGEPCHDNGGFDKSSCVQAWRWNLDKVVDRHGNVMTYTYLPETNSYGQNAKDTAASYIRGGTLQRIEYGAHDGVPAGGRVEFTVADRCVPGSTCTPDKVDNWPDVPWDMKCDATPCKESHSPTFWSTKRLSKVTTQVLRDGKFEDVDSWMLDQQFPKPGDGEKAALWLKGITHSGHVGDQLTLPPVTFEGTPLGNRVDKVDGISQLIRYRVNGVVSEAGGVISVHYADPDCSATSLPDKPEGNTKRCYPVTWRKKNFAERTDYFHKYVVETVTESDRIGANPEQVTSYEYLDGAAWHKDTSEFTKEDKRTWNEFRGFGRVRLRKGKKDDPSGPVTMTEQRFYRGMDGKATDSEKHERDDSDWLEGVSFETTTFDGEDDGKVVSRTITEPTWQGPTATRGEYKAYIVRTGSTDTYTTLASGERRRTRTESVYDDRGLLKESSDLGDTATDKDDKCARTTYVRNTGRWILNLPSESTTVAVRCSETPSYPADAISATRYAYDKHDFGDEPTAGDLTRTEQARERPAGGPVWTLAATAEYDVRGRVTESADALGRTTKTRFEPAVAGPLTKTVVTDAGGFESTNTVEPAWGEPAKVVDANERTTEITYDSLGRRSEVWLPNRPKGEYERGNLRFSYQIRNDAPSVTTTTKVGPNGRFSTVNELYDGLLRKRQIQSPAKDGRLLTDTRYDTQGRAYKTTRPYFTGGDVDDKLWIGPETDIPGLTVTEYDGAGRAIAEIYKAGGREKWRTTTSYGGDRVSVNPPRGGTATTTISDARGQVTEERKYEGASPSGDYDATKYTYTNAGEPATMVDPSGSTWRYTYDLLGNRTKVEDPDKGTVDLTYDAAGQLKTNTDARGVKLVYEYDDLGRKTRIRKDSESGPKLDEWTYDSAIGGKGKLATITRFVGDDEYKSTVEGYNALYQQLGTTVSIPEAEQGLAGSYTTWAKFNPDGSAYGKTLPRIGDLAKETVGYTYDDLGHLQTTSGGINNTTAKYVTATDYTGFGQTARVHLGEGTKRAWLSFYYDDGTGRLDRTIVDAEVARPMQSDLHYSYDAFGNLTSVADTPKDKPSDVQCYRYDNLRRLTQAWTPAEDCAADPKTDALSGPAPYWQSYTYDKIGNRRTETQHAAGGDTTREYTYPAADQPNARRLTAVRTRGPGNVDKQDTFAYDNSGNTTARNLTTGAQTLDWDAEGHLAKVTQAGKKTEFVYSPDGQRLIRRDPQGRTLYLDGQELRLDGTTGKLTATRYYEHGGLTVAMRTSTGVTWLASDHQGTAGIAIDNATQKVTQRRAMPFGGPRGAAVTFPGEKGFVGGTTDSSTGLTHLGARDYDPTTGRFISVDPLIGKSDAQQMNGYAYANNNPGTHADPSGLSWFSDALDWVGEQASRVVEHIADDPLKFVGEVVVGVVVAAAVVGVCATGVGCAIAAGIAGGMASGAYGYGSDVLNDKVEPSWEGFSDAVVTGGIVGGVTGGVLGGVGAALGRGTAPSLADDFLPKNLGAAPVPGVPVWGSGASHKGWLDQAQAMRDKAMDDALGQNRSTLGRTYTAGVDPKTGRIEWGASGANGCAECDVASKLNVPIDQILFTKAYSWRSTPENPTGTVARSGRGRYWDKEERPICANCQSKTHPQQYPAGTRYDSGGRWNGGQGGVTGGYRDLGNGNYITNDGRLCNRGGGMCAI